jgi:hypothetical protein
MDKDKLKALQEELRDSIEDNPITVRTYQSNFRGHECSINEGENLTTVECELTKKSNRTKKEIALSNKITEDLIKTIVDASGTIDEIIHG